MSNLKRHRAWSLGLLVATVISIVLSTACEDKRRHKVSETLEFEPIPPASGKDATPMQIARETLEAMRDLQHVRRAGLGGEENRQNYENAMGRLFGLAARDHIYAEVKPKRVQSLNREGQTRVTVEGSPFMPWDVTESAAVRKIVESWTSKTAHYIDGIDWDAMKQAASGEKSATVTVLAENARERERLESIENDVVKAAGGEPIERGSKAYWDQVRTRAIAEGFNVPIVAQITISLERQGDGWRVHAVDIGPMP